MHSDAPPGRARVQSVGPDLELLALIAQGGMASVYRARQTSLDRLVAVKVIDGYRTTPAMVERFGREARLASRLQHPHIVSIFGHGVTTSGSLWISMELLEGQTLAEPLRTEGALSAFRAIRIIRQILSGLAAAHEAGVLHRDLKPSNVFLCRPAGFRDDHAKLLDFGLAVRETNPEPITAANHVVGTVGYMSPEQSAGQPVDARSDLYSLGVLLHEMLFGRTVSPREPRAPNGAVPAGLPQLPGALIDLLDTLVAFRPDDRPASVHQVIDALDRIELGSPGSHAPAPTVATGTPGPTRPRLGWSTALLMPVAVVAWMGGATYGASLFEPAPAPVAKAKSDLARDEAPAAGGRAVRSPAPGSTPAERSQADLTSASGPEGGALGSSPAIGVPVSPPAVISKTTDRPPSARGGAARKPRGPKRARSKRSTPPSRCPNGVIIESTPPAAAVVVDGARVAATPYRLAPPRRPTRVRIEAPGFQGRTVVAKDEQPCRVRVQLTVRDPTVPVREVSNP